MRTSYWLSKQYPARIFRYTKFKLKNHSIFLMKPIYISVYNYCIADKKDIFLSAIYL